MVGLRYIGSKARVANEIMDVIGDPRGDGARLVDAFCGTGAVAAAAAQRGWAVHLNDTLFSSVVMASARLVGADRISMGPLGGYEAAVRRLNQLPGRKGFIARQYSPLSSEVAVVERRYFTVQNASRIDAVRGQIESWHRDGKIDETERQLLLADLMVSTNQVANTAGTYGCFLRDWSPGSLRPLQLEARVLPAIGADVSVSVGDVLDVPYAHGDVAYFDPPYTKRQYAAYYHILETVALGDEPVVEGVTGLRPWKHLASDYCYRSRALNALAKLVLSCPATRVFLSYSSDGHVARGDLEARLSATGDLAIHPVAKIGRYRPNTVAAERSHVDEYLFAWSRAGSGVGAVA